MPTLTRNLNAIRHTVPCPRVRDVATPGDGALYDACSRPRARQCVAHPERTQDFAAVNCWGCQGDTVRIGCDSAILRGYISQCQGAEQTRLPEHLDRRLPENHRCRFLSSKAYPTSRTTHVN
jgi:hypothetical protein